jgi:hypothetical protein
MRYSTRTLLFIFLVLSIGLAALRYASDILGAVFFTAAFFILLVSFVFAMVRRDASQTYWIGFTIFGGGYFLFVMFAERGLDPRSIAIIGSQSNTSSNAQAPSLLVTSHLLMWADSFTQNVWEFPGYAAPMSGPLNSETTRGFIAIGQSLFTLFFGVIGGWIADRWSRSSRSPGQ